MIKKQLPLLLALSCIGFTGFTQPKLVEKVTKKGNEVVIPYEKYVMPNGLTVIIHEDHSDPIVHTDVTYHVGSAREEIGKSGFAHFFEHMMFQGSDNVADEQHFKIITEAGGTLNGTTNRDRTNYFETVPSNQLEKMLWMEADRMGFLVDAVTQKKFEVQRATVKNERGQRYDNVPYGLASEYASTALYPYGHPYSWLTIGYVEDLNRVNVNDLKNFFLRWYGPNNATLTIGGDVNPKQALQWVDKYFGSIPKGPEVKNMPKMVPVLDKDRYVSYTDNYAKIPMLRMVFPTSASFSKDEAALDCLAEILGGGKNSILYQRLVKTQKALQVNVYNSSTELSGEFTITALPYPGKGNLADLEKEVRAAFAEFETRGVTEDDLIRFRASAEAQTINGLESVNGKVSQLAAFQTFTGNANRIGEELKKYTSVNKTEVVAAYNQYIKGKHAVILSVLPKGQESLIAGADNFKVDSVGYKAPDYGYTGLKYNKAKDNFDRSKMPAAGPNPVIKVPAFWRKDLANGVKAIGSYANEIPTVVLTLSFKGGHLTESKDKAGLANLFSDMMNEDTKNFSAEAMSNELEKLGSSIEFYAGKDAVGVQVRSLSKNLDKTLALLEERILRPNFTEDAFERNQKQTLEGIRNSKTRPANIASEVNSKLTFGDNILGISMSGTETTVQQISLQDIQEYYKNFMNSTGAELVIVGEVKENDVMSKLTFLDKLSRNNVSLPAKVEGIQPEKTKIYIVNIPRAAQSEFRVGYPTNLTYDATGEYYRAGLMNYTLGGAFNSRLNLNLREDKGWTYGARSGFSADQYTGTFAFSAGIKANVTDSALSEVMKEINEYRADGITPEELSFMKNSMGQSEALKYETGFQKAGFIGRILTYNLPADFTDQQNKILNNISKEEIDALAKKYLTTEKFNILIVGDKDLVTPGLQKSGYEIVELATDGTPVVVKQAPVQAEVAPAPPVEEAPAKKKKKK